MKKPFLAAAAVILIAAGPTKVLAQEDNNQSDYERNQSTAVGSSMDSPDMNTNREQQPGEAGYDKSGAVGKKQNQAGTASEDQSMAKDKDHGKKAESADSKETDAQKTAAKSKVGPHTIMIESSLQSAIDQVKGLKAQLDTSAQPNPEMMQHFKMHGQMINDDVKMARIHENELMTSAQQFPKLAQNDDFKSLQPVMNDVERLNHNLQAKLGSRDYWSKKDLVKNDLDRLEKQLSNAIDKTKSFSSDELGLKANIG